ncbi:MAG: hypothetical protein V4584_11700 [Verrucomicrobiota bacterium]
MPVTHLTDFSDRLSPMLVKELRQGMRARSFTMLFLIFQLLLAFILLTAGSAADPEDSGGIASGVIFTMFTIAVLFVQPMRGLTALSGEIGGNTIEMMVLTRLSASRIVLGKWIAIVSQSALILITIIPYLILRYFYGGMILFGEMVFLTLIFLTSMALTAVMVGLSGTTTKLIRVLPILGFIFMIQMVPMFLFRSGFNGFMSICTMSTWESRLGIFSYICFIAYVGWCALSYGTSVIAPIAENHSTIRRVVALTLACITAAIGLHDSINPQFLPLVFGIILAPAVLTALTEPSILLPPICKPFLKRGAAGRIASLFLLPGWPAGVFYTMLLVTISVVGVVLSHKPTSSPIDDVAAIVCLAFTGGILLPALLASNFTKQESKRFTNFIIFLLASVILTIIPAIFANMNHHEKYLWLFVWNPPVLLTMVDDHSFAKSSLLKAGLIVDAIYLVLLLITAAIAFRGYGRIFKEAEDELAAGVKPVSPQPEP